MGERVVFQRDLLATLRRRELDETAGEAICRNGPPAIQAAAPASYVAGVYRQRLTLSSGRFAMIDDGLGFQLLPWSREIERKLGQNISGAARNDGGIEWSIGRKRYLGL